jgi:hypothetical protein
VTVEQFPCGALAWITNCLPFGKASRGLALLENEKVNNGRADPVRS